MKGIIYGEQRMCLLESKVAYAQVAANSENPEKGNPEVGKFSKPFLRLRIRNKIRSNSPISITMNLKFFLPLVNQTIAFGTFEIFQHPLSRCLTSGSLKYRLRTPII